MVHRSINIYRTYQTSTHRTLGFYTGEEDEVLTFCQLKFDIESDDIALERVPVRQVTRTEVICLMEVMDQLKAHKENFINDSIESEAQKELIEIIDRIEVT